MQRPDAENQSITWTVRLCNLQRGTVKQYIERARAKFAAAGRPCRSNTVLLARCMEQGVITPQEVDDYRATQRGT